MAKTKKKKRRVQVETIKKKKRIPPLQLEAFGAPITTAVTVVPTSKPGAIAAVTDAFKNPSFQYLRYSAMVYYTTDLNGCSVEEMSRHPVYGGVGLNQLQRWCWADEWVKKRELTREQWRKKIEVVVGSKLAQARVRQMETLQKVYDKALLKLEGDLVEANSWEGVAGVLVRIAELMDDWRTRMGQEIWPAMTASAVEDGQAQSHVRPKLTRDEAREAALLIIQKRRSQLQAERAVQAQKALPDGTQVDKA